MSDSPALRPDMEYDQKGVFTGCFYPSGLQGGKDQLTVFYTSVCHLPVHWSIVNVRGAEGIAAAVSNDGGKTWTKVPENPILTEEPEDLSVTGFRDPYLAPWEAMDDILDQKSLYALVSGGTGEGGPTTFLYAVPSSDLRSWTYLGPLIDIPRNFKPSKKWSGDCGANLECTNFFSLDSGNFAREFLLTGSEGGKQREWLETKESTIPERPVRWCLWLSGSLQKTSSGPKFIYDFGGIFDHGSWYAANSFHDPITNSRIVWGWIPEEDVPDSYHDAKGWNGCLGVPRTLFLGIIPNVTGALRSSLEDIPAVKQVQKNDGSISLHTLGIKPLPALTALRGTQLAHLQNISFSSLPELLPISVPSTHWELSATITISPNSQQQVGFYIRHTRDLSVRTKISFSPEKEEIVVERYKSNSRSATNRCDERGPHTLFKMDDGLEKLRLTIFCDGDVLEVFANERFALATMVYTDDIEATGISLFVDGQDEDVLFEEVRIWEMDAIRHE